MKKIIAFEIIIISALCCSFISCKKDYPSDIPDWLKKEIREYKRNNEYNPPYNSLTIEEWQFNGQTVYNFYNYELIVYDNTGNFICNNLPGDLYCRCGDTSYEIKSPEWKRVRLIWAASDHH